MKRSEADLAAAVVAYLQADGWTVHEEVYRTEWLGRPDIVALRGPVVQIVEVKTSLSLALLDQIIDHRCTLRSIAAQSVPGRAAFKLLNAEGIGYYQVFDNDSGHVEVREKIEPKIRREFYDDARRWRSQCCIENAAGFSVAKAGTRDGGYWTPFRHTMDDVKRSLQDAGGRMELKDLMARLPDGRRHYVSSATCRASLLHLIGTKVIPWARVVRDGRTVYIELKRDEEE